jgi:CBS domain containing-hemolysin-like protein
MRIGSRNELQHLVDQSDGILSAEEKQLVVHSLSFSDKVVGDIMIPISKVVSIKKSELLGPLMLDELHKSGHSRLPVIASDVDHIVGILHLDNLLALDTKRSVTAEKAMDSHVHYIRYDQTLPKALTALLRTHQHIFIVVDESRQTKGIITLNDVIEALIGRKIVDDFDEHESLRAVSEHNPQRDI